MLWFASASFAQAPQVHPAGPPVPSPTANPASPADRVNRPAAKNAAWSTLDLNEDGFISKKEADENSGLKALFDDADANGDGRLSASEYHGYMSGFHLPKRK
ncbi:hypothetical protein ACHZ97_09420 [Lysobacter soli]|uniref:hypothetical protein n=1 Tax=Lysobacter soli TaxID=453783 RepID=UPI0037C60BE6